MRRDFLSTYICRYSYILNGLAACISYMPLYTVPPTAYLYIFVIFFPCSLCEAMVCVFAKVILCRPLKKHGNSPMTRVAAIRHLSIIERKLCRPCGIGLRGAVFFCFHSIGPDSVRVHFLAFL